MKSNQVPAKEVRTEIQVLNSRFQATAGPVFSTDEAREFVIRVRADHASASHNVPAYLVGHGATVIAHCRDDGEPSGTAGRPALAVLKGSGLGDVAVVVSRYFGGTKLGTGGLVRAYGDAVRTALAILPRALKVITHTVEFETPYSLYERAQLLVGAHGGIILAVDFAAHVSVKARFITDAFPPFKAALLELSNGTVEAVIVEANMHTVMPIEETAV